MLTDTAAGRSDHDQAWGNKKKRLELIKLRNLKVGPYGDKTQDSDKDIVLVGSVSAFGGFRISHSKAFIYIFKHCKTKDSIFFT